MAGKVQLLAKPQLLDFANMVERGDSIPSIRELYPHIMLVAQSLAYYKSRKPENTKLHIEFIRVILAMMNVGGRHCAYRKQLLETSVSLEATLSLPFDSVSYVRNAIGALSEEDYLENDLAVLPEAKLRNIIFTKYMSSVLFVVHGRSEISAYEQYLQARGNSESLALTYESINN